MVEEMRSIESNGTWHLVDLPSGRIAEDGEVVRFRARLVTQRYSQQYGTDYDQVFAPVGVRQTTSRTPLAVAAKQGMTVRQFDVKTAVLYWSLDDEIYFRQPPEFVVQRTRGIKATRKVIWPEAAGS